jgi:hypothetical protein
LSVASERQSLAFVFCVDSGPLEEQAILLARSIRRWAGAYADSQIYGFRPRGGAEKLAPTTYAAFKELDIHFNEEVLNVEHSDYVHTNTIYSLLWAEQHLDEEVLVWCDSDKVFLSEPSSFDLAPGVDAAAAGPYYHTAGDPKSTGPGDPKDPYWRRMYELAGVTAEPYLTALADGARVRAFWNAGLIVFRRRAGLAAEWLDLFGLLRRRDHLPEGQLLNLDQLSLAALLARRPEAVLELDHRYNHNLALRARLPEPERSFTLADLVSVHYHIWFNRLNFLEDLRPPLDPQEERYRWLQAFLPLEPVNTRPLPGLEPQRKRRRDRRGPRRWRRLWRRVRRAFR